MTSHNWVMFDVYIIWKAIKTIPICEWIWLGNGFFDVEGRGFSAEYLDLLVGCVSCSLLYVHNVFRDRQGITFKHNKLCSLSKFLVWIFGLKDLCGQIRKWKAWEKETRALDYQMDNGIVFTLFSILKLYKVTYVALV